MLKSLLHKSSDIFKAINEAWQQSESPEVFTVKIIDPGKKGFLGFAHKPAIISFTYEQTQSLQSPSCQLKTVIQEANLAKHNDCAVLPENRESKKTPSTEKIQPRNQSPKTVKKEDCAPQSTTKSEPAKQKSGQNTQPTQGQRTKTTTQISVEKPVQTRRVQKSSNEAADQDMGAWDDLLAAKATAWLGTFFKNFGMIGLAKTIKVEDRLLTVSIEKSSDKDSILPQLLTDNLFVCACATLAVQSLRNQTSQRLKGLRIKILSANNE